MKFLIDLLNLPKRSSGRKFNLLLCYVAFGLLVTMLVSNKTNIALESIAVSQDERHIACFERGNGRKIRCFSSDGSLEFDFMIPSDISAGGHCTLWFEEDVLCALFYRTDLKVSLSVDGSILEIVEYSSEELPPEFDSFSRKGPQYIFDGSEIDVMYNNQTLFGYWILGEERYLAITPKSGETIIVCAWTAGEGIIK